MTPWLRAQGGGVEINLHVQPGASRCELAGEHGEALKVRIAARAVEGSANAALREFIAECLGVARREVRILRGEKSRRKVLWAPIDPELARRKLAVPPAPEHPPGRPLAGPSRSWGGTENDLNGENTE